MEHHRIRISAALLTSIALWIQLVSGRSIENNIKFKGIPRSTVESDEADRGVSELHRLLTAVTEVSISKSDAPNHRESSEDKDDDKRMVAPSEHEFLLNEFASNRETPADFAEYIFWTGDERSVVVAIEEFVDQELMSAEEGKEFLQEIHDALREIQLRYGKARQKTAELQTTRTEHSTTTGVRDEVRQLAQELAYPAPEMGIIEKPQREILVAAYSDEHERISKGPRHHDDTIYQVPYGAHVQSLSHGKEEHKDEMHLVDILNSEDTLEEIIYQLAKMIVSNSLSHAGHPEAEEALKKFADFLDNESKEGKMPVHLQRKVLDVLLMSLLDAMGDENRQDGIRDTMPIISSSSSGGIPTGKYGH